MTLTSLLHITQCKHILLELSYKFRENPFHGEFRYITSARGDTQIGMLFLSRSQRQAAEAHNTMSSHNPSAGQQISFLLRNSWIASLCSLVRVNSLHSLPIQPSSWFTNPTVFMVYQSNSLHGVALLYSRKSNIVHSPSSNDHLIAFTHQFSKDTVDTEFQDSALKCTQQPELVLSCVTCVIDHFFISAN